MSRAWRHDQAHYDAGVVRMEFGIVCNNTSDPTKYYDSSGSLSTTLPAGIVSVVYSATGILTLTFVDQFYTALNANVHLQLATAADSCAQFNGFTNLGTTSTLTAVITTLTAGSAAAIAAADTSVIWCNFSFKVSAAK